MPKIWADTIDGHRRQVNAAILDAAAAIAIEQGPMALSMAGVAERAGIGRATLYKYFADVEAILTAWHLREVSEHLDRLHRLADDTVTLDDIAALIHGHRDAHPAPSTAISALASTVAASGADAHELHAQVFEALTAVLADLARRGEVRSDHRSEDLAHWVLHAVHAPLNVDTSTVADLVTTSLKPTDRP